MVDSPYPQLKKTHTMAHVGRPWTDYKPPAAAPVWDVIEGFGRFHVLCSAVELGVFDQLESGPANADDLAERLDVSAPHLETLLEGVVAMGLLDRRFRVFELNDTARRYLLSASPASMAALLPVSPGPLDNWSKLTDTVRSGAPADPIDDDPAAFYVPLVEGTFTTINRCATRADLQLRYSALGPIRLLDLGAGGAPWTAAVLAANAEATAVVNDLDGVIGVARRELAARDLTGRVDFRSGSFHDIELERDHFDLVVLGHVCRTEGEIGTQSLIARAYQALRPGGRLLIGDYFADEQRSRASHALMMGVTMMASTRNGAVFTHGQIGQWLAEAGFEAVRVIEPIGFQEVFVATRPTSGSETTDTTCRTAHDTDDRTFHDR